MKRPKVFSDRGVESQSLPGCPSTHYVHTLLAVEGTFKKAREKQAFPKIHKDIERNLKHMQRQKKLTYCFFPVIQVKNMTIKRFPLA